MNKLAKTICLAAATMIAGPALAATTVDLSATNFAASSATLNLAAGDYTVSLVKGAYTAWAPARTGVDGNGVNIPGANWGDYYRYAIDGGPRLNANPFDPAAPRYVTPDDAFAAYTASGPLKLSFTTPTSVTFSIADDEHSFWDNSGGVSLSIAAVPEPATWAMMLIGFLGIAVALRTKPRHAVDTAAV